MSHVQLINEEGGFEQRQKTDQWERRRSIRGMLQSGSYMHTCMKEMWWRQLTFDSGNNSSSCTEDVHRVEPLVFADYGLQDSQQLPETLVHRLVEALLVLWKYNSLQ